MGERITRFLTGLLPVLGVRLRRHSGERGGVISQDKIVVYAILFALAGAPKAMYSFTCCPDSSVVERHLGKMEVPGSIPGRGSHDDNLRFLVDRGFHP